MTPEPDCGCRICPAHVYDDEFVDAPLEKVFTSPDRLQAALDSLGAPGDLAEAYVHVAAAAGIHALRGGRLEYVVTKEEPHAPSS